MRKISFLLVVTMILCCFSACKAEEATPTSAETTVPETQAIIETTEATLPAETVAASAANSDYIIIEDVTFSYNPNGNRFTSTVRVRNNFITAVTDLGFRVEFFDESRNIVGNLYFSFYGILDCDETVTLEETGTATLSSAPHHVAIASMSFSDHSGTSISRHYDWVDAPIFYLTNYEELLENIALSEPTIPETTVPETTVAKLEPEVDDGLLHLPSPAYYFGSVIDETYKEYKSGYVFEMPEYDEDLVQDYIEMLSKDYGLKVKHSYQVKDHGDYYHSLTNGNVICTTIYWDNSEDLLTVTFFDKVATIE